MEVQQEQAVEIEAPVVSATDDAAAEDAEYNKIWDSLHSDGGEAPAVVDAVTTDEPKAETRARDEAGKFISKETKEPVADVGEDPASLAKAEDESKDAQKQEGEAEPPTIAAPVSLSADMKAKWDDLPSEWKQTLATREQEAAQAISRMGNELHSAKPMTAIAEQYQGQLQQMGIQPHEAFKNLMEHNASLMRDPATGIRNLAQSMGVDLVDLALMDDAGTTQPDPQIAHLTQQVQQLQGMLQQGQSGQSNRANEVEQHNAAIYSHLDTFAADNPDFESLGPMIEVLIPTIQAEAPLASADVVLEEAYSRARWANPTTRDALQKTAITAQQQEASKRADMAKRAGKLNVTSAVKPTGDSFKTEDEAMAAIYDRAHSGA